MQMKTIYIAKDGKEFDTAKACLAYEESIKKYKYVVIYTNYDFDKREYKNKTYFKFEYRKEQFKYISVTDLIDSYLSSLIGYRTIFSLEHGCYYNQYSFYYGDTTKELCERELNAEFYDITNEIYSARVGGVFNINDMINE